MEHAEKEEIRSQRKRGASTGSTVDTASYGCDRVVSEVAKERKERRKEGRRELSVDASDSQRSWNFFLFVELAYGEQRACISRTL